MGLEGSGRDELAFLEEVLGDATLRWPVDESRVYVSGQSLGASMAYQAACELGDRFAALALSSGGFWDPMPSACAAPAMPVCHIHGNNDTTWPLEGREVTEGDQQGLQVPVDEDIAFWRSHDDCTQASTTYDDGMLSRTSWSECADGVEVNLCLHDGGHALPDGWTEREVAWLLQFER